MSQNVWWEKNAKLTTINHIGLKIYFFPHSTERRQTEVNQVEVEGEIYATLSDRSDEEVIEENKHVFLGHSRGIL